MITQAESGLDPTQYAALAAAQDDAAFQVIAHRYNLRFATVQDGGTEGRDFASCVLNDILYRINDSGLQSYVTGWTTVTGVTIPSHQDNKPPSLVTDGSTLAAFYATSTGISRRTSGSFAAIVTDSNVEYIAAVSPTRVHYIVNDASTHLHRLKVADLVSGSWVITASEIYFPYPIAGLAANRLNGTDILVLTTQVPGALSVKLVNNKAVNTILQSGGLIGFTYKYGTWSDHFEIDVLDELHDWRFRLWPRLTRIDNTLYLTSFFGDGTERTPYGGYRLYRSKDLRHWTRGEVLPVPDAAQTNGIELQRIGDVVYAVENKQLHTSASTLLTGNSTVQIDITEDIEAYQLSHGDMLTAQISVNNEEGWVETSILNGENRVWLEHKGGYWVDGEKLLVSMGWSEVDAVTRPQDLTDHSQQIVTRDALAWMTDRTQSETFHNWESQLVAGDDFVDASDTNYGGLGHTAGIVGSFQTPQDASALAISTSNEECIALSTWKTDLWNGDHSGYYKLATLGNKEFAGICFRTRDKDNGFFFVYYNQTDKLKLFKREGGTETQLYLSSAMSWNDLNWHGLRARFYYGRLDLYTSASDGVWTLHHTHYLNGQGDSTTPILTAASVGWIGRGYAPADVWTVPPLIPIPAYPYDPFPYDGSDDAPEIPLITSEDPAPPGPRAITMPYVAKFASNGQYYWTDNYNDDLGPTWHNWNLYGDLGIIGAIHNVVHDGGHDYAVIVFTQGNIYRINNIYTTLPSKTLLRAGPLNSLSAVSSDGSVIASASNTDLVVSYNGGGSFVTGSPTFFDNGDDQTMHISSIRVSAANEVIVSAFYLIPYPSAPGYYSSAINYFAVSSDLTTMSQLSSVTAEPLVSDHPIPGSSRSFLVGQHKKWTPAGLTSILPAGSVATSMSDSAVWWSYYVTGSTWNFIKTQDAGVTWDPIILSDALAGQYRHVFAADLDGDTAIFVRGNAMNFWNGVEMVSRLGNLSFSPSPDNVICLTIEE